MSEETFSRESEVASFGAFTLDRRTRELVGPDGGVNIEPKVFDLLVFLLDNKDRVVSKDDLIENIWDGRAISEAALSTAIRSARKATGDDGKSQSVIRTVHGRGFRFVAEIEQFQAEPEEPPAPKETNDVEAEAVSSPDPVMPPLSERAWVSVLGIELGASKVHALDIEDVADVMDAVRVAAGRIVEGLGGSLFEVSQTGFGYVFGHSGRSEEHAYRACKAARDLCEAVQKNAGVPLSAGIDTGEALVEMDAGSVRVTSPVTRNAFDLARSLAEPGIVVSGAIAQDVRGSFELRPLPERGMGADGEKERAFAIVGEASALSRWMLRSDTNLTQFVGREIEISILQRALSQVNGNGRLIGICGDPGVGKSRLAIEFLDRLKQERVFQCGAMEVDQSTPLSLIRRLVRSMVKDMTDPDNPAPDSQLIAQGIGEEHADALGFLLGSQELSADWKRATGGERNESILQAVLALMTAQSTSDAAVFLIEDLQWMDEVSASALHQTIQSLPTINALTVATFRDDAAPTWLRGGTHEIINLSALNASESAEMMEHLLGASTQRTSASVFDLTGGNPFFIEQTAQSFHGAPHDDKVRLPPSVQSVLVSNTRRLKELPRQIVRIAAIHGRPISHDMLANVAGKPVDEVSTACAALCDQGFLALRRARPQRAYAPQHALLQKSVTTSLTRRARVDLHRRLYGAMVGSTAGQDAAADFARHSLGGELWEDAAKHSLAAALSALDVAAGELALWHVNNGLAALDQLPEGPQRDKSELAFRKMQGVANMVAKGWSASEVADAYDRAAELSDKVGDEAERFIVMRGKAQYLMISGNAEDANNIAHHCCKIVDDRFSDNSEFQIETSHMFWTNGFFLGNYNSVLHHTELGRDQYDVNSHRHLASKYSGHDPGVCCRIFSAMVKSLRGDFGSSDAMLTESRSLSQQLDHPLTAALVHWADAYCALFQKDADAALRHSEAEIECCEQYKLPFLKSQALVTKGWAIGSLGGADEGIRLMQDGIAGIRSSGAQMGLQYFLSLLAQALLDQGRFEEANVAIQQAEAIVEDTRAHFQYSEVLRVKALLACQAKAGHDDISLLFNRSLEYARQQSASVSERNTAADFQNYLENSGKDRTER